MVRLSDLLDADGDLVDLRDLPLGNQTPTHRLVPECQFSRGQSAIRFAHEVAGYRLDQFQQDALIDFLGVNILVDQLGQLIEQWAATETADVESRRNGKSAVIEVLILYGLFVLGERIMYTAHRDDTAKAIFDRVVAACKRSLALWSEIVPAGPRSANGQREIRLKDRIDKVTGELVEGPVVIFRTRTFDSARGEGFDRLIIDEAQSVQQVHMAALSPLTTGQPNAQTNYAGSAGDLKAEVLAGLWRSFERRERSLAYRGWHANPDDDFADVDVIARVNPAAGGRLSWIRIAKEFMRQSRVQFGRERCGVATYPREEGEEWVIPKMAWNRARDPESTAVGPLVFVPEIDPELTLGTISVAGRRADGAMHIEVVARRAGMTWMAARLLELARKHKGAIAIDPKGPAGPVLTDLLHILEEEGSDSGLVRPNIVELTQVDLKDAFTWFTLAINPRRDDNVDDSEPPAPTVRHRGGRLITTALAVATVRKLLDRYWWQRHSEVNQGPLVGCTIAAYAVVMLERVKPPDNTSPTQGRRGPRKRTDPRRSPSATADLATKSF